MGLDTSGPRTYRRQIRGLLDGGVDLLVAETLLYPHEAELIWEAAALEDVTIPMIYTFTMDPAGALFSGRGPFTAMANLMGTPFSVYIISCSL